MVYAMKPLLFILLMLVVFVAFPKYSVAQEPEYKVQATLDLVSNADYYIVYEILNLKEVERGRGSISPIPFTTPNIAGHYLIRAYNELGESLRSEIVYHIFEPEILEVDLPTPPPAPIGFDIKYILLEAQ